MVALVNTWVSAVCEKVSPAEPVLRTRCVNTALPASRPVVSTVKPVTVTGVLPSADDTPGTRLNLVALILSAVMVKSIGNATAARAISWLDSANTIVVIKNMPAKTTDQKTFRLVWPMMIVSVDAAGMGCVILSTIRDNGISLILRGLPSC